MQIETAKIGMSAPGVGQSTFFPRRRSTSIKPKLSVTVATGLTVPTACATWAVKLWVKERITWSRQKRKWSASKRPSIAEKKTNDPGPNPGGRTILPYLIGLVSVRSG